MLLAAKEKTAGLAVFSFAVSPEQNPNLFSSQSGRGFQLKRIRQGETFYLGVFVFALPQILPILFFFRFPPAGGVWGGMRAEFRLG
ncbi:MAG: hypothetical protein WCO30_02915, partial [bacterium]